MFPREVAALEQIWNREFFGNEGLTIVYREPTDFLDEAVPLHVFTDMYHYVSLSRCSLVVNRGINLARIAATAEELSSIFSKVGQTEESKAEGMRRVVACFQKDRFGTMGFLQRWRLLGSHEKALQSILADLERRLNESL